MTPQEKTLSRLITEIALRCTAKVCVGFSPARVETVAAPLSEGLIELVIVQGDRLETADFAVKAPNYHCFELWNRIIDEIEKEIPIAAKIEVTATVTRAQRRNFNEGQWADGKMTRREIAALHPDQEGNA